MGPDTQGGVVLTNFPRHHAQCQRDQTGAQANRENDTQEQGGHNSHRRHQNPQKENPNPALVPGSRSSVNVICVTTLAQTVFNTPHIPCFTYT